MTKEIYRCHLTRMDASENVNRYYDVIIEWDQASGTFDVFTRNGRRDQYGDGNRGTRRAIGTFDDLPAAYSSAQSRCDEKTTQSRGPYSEAHVDDRRSLVKAFANSSLPTGRTKPVPSWLPSDYAPGNEMIGSLRF